MFRYDKARPVRLEPLDESALREVALLVAALQADPSHHIGYLGTDADSLAEQIAALEPEGVAGAVVAREDGGAVVGLLAGEWDTDPPRVWWHGPLIRDGDDWHEIADRLHAAASALLPDEVTQAELAPDARNERVAAFGQRHGFTADTASAVLSRSLAAPPEASPPDGVTVRGLRQADRPSVAALHDHLFPATHTPGARLDEGSARIVLVAVDGDTLLGYVAAEVQEGGDGYLDFLGVAQEARGRGIARALVAEVSSRLSAAGSQRAHLTVREDNQAARHLYVSLGFDEERILVPWRRTLATAE